MMRSKAVREGGVGLLILGGVLTFAGFFIWLYNLRFGTEGYTFTVLYDTVSGLSRGANVRLRGVTVGRIESVMPASDAVRVEVEINSMTPIPRQSTFITSQTGLVGETILEIFPSPGVGADIASQSPVAPTCDSNLIVCTGDEIAGVSGVDYAELLTSLDELSNRLNDDEFFGNLNATLVGITGATEGVSELSATLEAQLGTLNTEELDLAQITAAASTFQQTAQSLEQVSDNLLAILTDNRGNLDTSLQNVEQITEDVKSITESLEPLLTNPDLQNDVETIVTNLTIASESVIAAADGLGQVSDNAVELTEDLKEVVAELNDPGTLATLRQTLDSARVTFQNTEKITADLDELTGDPQFRQNIRDMVNGLSSLVSSSPDRAQPAPATYTEELEIPESEPVF